MRAIAILALAVGACVSGSTLHPDAIRHNAEGAQLLAEGELDDAEARFRLALEYNKRFSEPHANLGAVALRRGNLDQAESHLREAIALNPDFAEAYANLGIVHEQRDRKAQARQAYKKALSIQPGLAAPRHNLSVLLLGADEHEAARAHLLRLVQVTPDDPFAHSLLAYADVRLGRMADARQRTDQVLADNPDDPIARVVRGIVLAHEGKFGAAERQLKAGLDHPIVGDGARARLAALYVADTKPKRAWPLVNAMLAQDETDPAANLLAAYLRRGEGRWRSVKQHAGRVLEVRADSEEAQELLNEACKRVGGAGCASGAVR